MVVKTGGNVGIKYRQMGTEQGTGYRIHTQCEGKTVFGMGLIVLRRDGGHAGAGGVDFTIAQ